MIDSNMLMFSDIVKAQQSIFVADNSSTGLSATKSYFNMINDDSIISIVDKESEVVIMIMPCEDGVLSWVYGTIDSVQTFVNNLNQEG